MILLKVQENIERCNAILQSLESDILFKISKCLKWELSFEGQIRVIYDESINLRNNIIIDTEAAIRATENKELIAYIESNYFQQITQANTSNAAIKIINSNSISIPQTAMNIIAQDDKVVNLIKDITTKINLYNASINSLRQEWNKLHLTLYRFPKLSKFPKIIDSQITFQNLIVSSKQNAQSTINNKTNNSTIGTTTMSNTKVGSITNKF